jgi:hypothetical protein
MYTGYKRLNALLVAALIAVPVSAALPWVAGAAPGDVTKADLTISSDDNPIVFDSSTTISGRIKNSTVKTGVVVTLEQNPYPFTGGYQTVATATTGTNGRYSFSNVSPEQNTRYRVTSVVPQAVSAELLLKVRIKVVLRLSDSTPSRGERVRFYGTATPEHDGRLVNVQRRSASGRWRTVKKTFLRDAGTELSSFATRIRVRRDGTYRARVYHDSDHEDGTSRTKRASVG